MSERTGDPLLDHLEELTHQGIKAGYQYPLPIKMSEPDGVIRRIILRARENLLRKGVEPPEMPLEVQEFFFGGPRPPITD